MMLKAAYDIVIAGGGMAGLAAAATLSGHGLTLLVIDENGHKGGQFLRGPIPKKRPFPTPPLDPIKARGYALMQTAREAGDITWLNRAEITGIFRDRQLLVRKMDTGTCAEVRAGRLIFATGARERYLPFPGWTLPNVISLGAAQILMKSHGVLPAARTLLGGSSPLMLAVAGGILSAGGQVAGLADENGLKEKFAFAPLAARHWPKLIQAGALTARAALNRVPAFSRYRIIESRGETAFRAAVIAKTDPGGLPIAGSEKIVQAGALAVGYGFVPNIELPVQAGCPTVFDQTLGGWVVQTDEAFETPCPRLFAVGEVTGIGGAEKSLVEGRICGLSILAQLGKIPKKRRSGVDKTLERLRQQHRDQTAYAAFFNTLTRVPGAAYARIPDDTMVCRCEGVTMGQIKKRVRQGFTTIPGLKKASRAGMGFCQGRICGPVIGDIITALTGQPPETAGRPLARPPVKNIPVEALLS